MDAFSEVLGGLRLKGAVYFRAALSAPWSVKAPHSSQMVSVLSPGAEHLVIYHLVVEGSMIAQAAGGEPIAMGPGDIIVFPHGDAHELRVGTTAPEIDETSVMAKIGARDLSPLRSGGGGAITQVVCGFMACDPLLCRPILAGLPHAITVNVRTDRAGHWLEHSILHLADEAAANRPGSEAILSKLSEALFVDTLRRYVASLPEHSTGWLAGARDEAIGKTLALMHGRPAHPWTIAELADQVGLSRSVLVERFTKYLPEPPMGYLANWRMRLASQALASTSKGVAEIAAEVGYESEAAFSRAFKRAFGVPPARYRREERGRTSSLPAQEPGVPVKA